MLRHGVELLGLRQPVKLAEFRPALAMNPDILARDAANRANRAKGLFLARVSHDLRIPLQTLSGYLALSRREQPGGTMGRYLGMIEKSGQAMLGLIEELLQFAEAISAPVTNTFMGLAGFPGEHPLFLGMLGLHGTRYANLAITECDLLIGLGARFDDRVVMNINNFAPRATVIHIDIDPAEIGKVIATNVPLVGDVKMILKALLPLLEKKDRSEWLNRILSLKKQYPLSYSRDCGSLKPQILSLIHISEHTRPY